MITQNLLTFETAPLWLCVDYVLGITLPVNVDLNVCLHRFSELSTVIQCYSNVIHFLVGPSFTLNCISHRIYDS
jgi:hypothetical protein